MQSKAHQTFDAIPHSAISTLFASIIFPAVWDWSNQVTPNRAVAIFVLLVMTSHTKVPIHFNGSAHTSCKTNKISLLKVGLHFLLYGGVLLLITRLVVQSLAAPVCKLLSNAFIIVGMLASKAEKQSRQ